MTVRSAWFLACLLSPSALLAQSVPSVLPAVPLGGSVLGHSQPGKPAHTPVVQPPKGGHAVKVGAHPTPAVTKPATAKPAVAKPTVAKPAATKPAAKPPPKPEPPAPSAEPAPAAPAEPAKGTATGLPLPRYVSLRADEVNLRTGPGTRYPIDWLYRRRDLPVEVEREFEVWRLIRDADGVKGWVHQATLAGRRTLVVQGTAEQVLRHAADDASEPVARLKPGVIGRIRACEATAAWCEVQVGDYRGWLKRDAFWGTYPGEAVSG